MREGTISQNWVDLVKRSSQSGELENIDLKDNWFNPYLEEDLSESSSHDPSITPDNNNKTLTLPQYKPHVQSSPSRERLSSYELHKRPDS